MVLSLGDSVGGGEGRGRFGGRGGGGMNWTYMTDKKTY